MHRPLLGRGDRRGGCQQRRAGARFSAWNIVPLRPRRSGHRSWQARLGGVCAGQTRHLKRPRGTSRPRSPRCSTRCRAHFMRNGSPMPAARAAALVKSSGASDHNLGPAQIWLKKLCMWNAEHRRCGTTQNHWRRIFRPLSLLQNYRVILSGRRVEALCEGGGDSACFIFGASAISWRIRRHARGAAGESDRRGGSAWVRN